jgi:vacuolar-type H+-ATPase subunit I/STV1
MRKQAFLMLVTFFGAVSVPMAAQEARDKSLLEMVAAELGSIRTLLEQQIRQTAQFELIRVKASRIGDLQRRLDALQEERETDENLLRELNQSRAAAPEEDRAAIEIEVRQTMDRISALTRKAALLQAEIESAEKSLERFVGAMSMPTALAKAP